MKNLSWTLTRLLSPLSGLAVSLQEAKKHLRISGPSMDSELELLIEAGTERLERDINRGIMQATWRQSQYRFPVSGEKLALQMGAATNVSSITYVDSDDVTQTLDPNLYEFSVSRGCVFILSGTWPEVEGTSSRDKVFINFTCGVADEECVPRLYKQAILLEVGRAYFDPAQENGVNTNDGKSYEAIVQKLLRSSYP
jgi:uncharacterized phiE125 gp8 family phage protein